MRFLLVIVACSVMAGCAGGESQPGIGGGRNDYRLSPCAVSTGKPCRRLELSPYDSRRLREELS